MNRRNDAGEVHDCSEFALRYGGSDSFRVVHRTGMSSFRFFMGPVLAQRYIICYGICYGFWQHGSTRLCSISRVKAFRTVSSIGRASDS